MFLQIHGKNDIGSILSKLHALLLGTAQSTGRGTLITFLS